METGEKGARGDVGSVVVRKEEMTGQKRKEFGWREIEGKRGKRR